MGGKDFIFFTEKAAQKVIFRLDLKSVENYFGYIVGSLSVRSLAEI
jgi:hypothetical protein